MGYNIDISFDIYKNSSISELKDDLIKIAEKNYCNPFYDIYYEMENGLKVNQKRHHCIMTFNFDKSKIINFIKFVNSIKNNKPFHIETIYDDNDETKIIYASKYYKSIMINGNNYGSLNSSDNLILTNMNKNKK